MKPSKQSLSRRGFLKTSAAALATASIGSAAGLAQDRKPQSPKAAG